MSFPFVWLGEDGKSGGIVVGLGIDFGELVFSSTAEGMAYRSG